MMATDVVLLIVVVVVQLIVVDVAPVMEMVALPDGGAAHRRG